MKKPPKPFSPMDSFAQIARGYWWAERWSDDAPATPAPVAQPDNPLYAFFERRAREGGHGIWKWLHYFDVYDRHLRHLRGRTVDLMEVGVFSGGSLDLWRDYFAADSTIHGADIAPGCRAYANDRTQIFIGDQESRAFWRDVKRQTPTMDVVIDDGGHETEQQIVTLEEMLPRIRPGGVYICEDIHGRNNAFFAYLHGLVCRLNDSEGWEDVDGGHRSTNTSFQRRVYGLHFYPYIVAIEIGAGDRQHLQSVRHGTQWKPYEA